MVELGDDRLVKYVEYRFARHLAERQALQRVMKGVAHTGQAHRVVLLVDLGASQVREAPLD